MKKIPTLFERVFRKHRIVEILPNVIPGMEWVLEGEGDATIKIDGSCCAIIDGEIYKRYDAKEGRKPPEGAVPCCDPDPITGHHPHWVKVDLNNPSDKWFVKAFKNSPFYMDGTYEAIGPHFNGNPHKVDRDMLFIHGSCIVNVERTFEGIKQYLTEHAIEGLVFWKDGEPQCKIKRTDFGLPWPVKEEKMIKIYEVCIDGTRVLVAELNAAVETLPSLYNDIRNLLCKPYRDHERYWVEAEIDFADGTAVVECKMINGEMSVRTI